MFRDSVLVGVLLAVTLVFVLASCGGRRNDGWSPALTGAVVDELKRGEDQRR